MYVHISKLTPGSFLIVDGPAIIHLNIERGHVVAASDIDDSTGIAFCKGNEIRALTDQHGKDCTAIVRQIKDNKDGNRQD